MHTVVRRLVLLGTMIVLGTAHVAAQHPTTTAHAPDSAAAAPKTAATQAAPAPSPITVSGVVYAQYLYQLKDTANHINNFDVTRAYVNVLGKFSGGLATRRLCR